MSDNRETVIEEYGNDCRIVHEERNYPDLYHVLGSAGQMKSFENLHAARLYADVYTILGGFDEKQTGKRGIPPAIARASEELRMTYFAVQMSVTYAALAFEVDDLVIHDAIERVHARAESQRSLADNDA
ncbi:hypothetical protein ACFQGE_14935 [Halomicroarcula sp. GCM10025817]|uniref:hypothetical protein n=1 Tax=Haloarcula TaxID=2237 RepID=UPI0023E8B92F|nr:hypothetical protein [Halomicroarcula sp. SYNS111]